VSGDRPKLISTPASFSQGVARTDMRTWGVMAILLAIAVAIVLTFGFFHKKVPMFGNAPFGQGRPPAQPQRLHEIPVVHAPPR